MLEMLSDTAGQAQGALRMELTLFLNVLQPSVRCQYFLLMRRLLNFSTHS
eukprot:COSAG01_NODE_46096_length_403_cov_0.861842_1_plen_49_part_10